MVNLLEEAKYLRIVAPLHFPEDLLFIDWDFGGLIEPDTSLNPFVFSDSDQLFLEMDFEFLVVEKIEDSGLMKMKVVSNGMRLPNLWTIESHIKVRDESEFYLLDDDMNPIAKHINDYVPEWMGTNDEDYLRFEINRDGVLCKAGKAAVKSLSDYIIRPTNVICDNSRWKFEW